MVEKQVVDLVCPRCGYKLGEQALFQEYEQRVATWLNGEVCASLNPAFDVWKCAEFPGLTFQVKYSTIGHKRNRSCWTWNQHKPGSDPADYFVLFGIEDDGTDHCFLLRSNQWLAISSNSTGEMRILQMIPWPYSRRGQNRKNLGYVHENAGWKYEVKNPEENLLERVRTLESYRQFEMF